MPIWLRKFTFNKIQKYHSDKVEESKPKQSTKQTLSKGPNIPSTSYSTKASKK
jgi:hypothetical protein